LGYSDDGNLTCRTYVRGAFGVVIYIPSRYVTG
jgi:hypothetical protein